MTSKQAQVMTDKVLQASFEDGINTEILQKIQLTRKTLIEKENEPLFQEIAENSIVRFSINSGKYIVGFVKSISELKTPYVVTY